MDKGENEGRQGVAVAADEADNSDNDKHSDDSLECDRLRTKDSHSDNSNSDYCDSLDGSDGVPKVKGRSELNNNLVQLDGVTCTESSDHVETLSSHQVHHEDIIAHILQKENDNVCSRIIIILGFFLADKIVSQGRNCHLDFSDFRGDAISETDEKFFGLTCILYYLS